MANLGNVSKVILNTFQIARQAPHGLLIFPEPWIDNANVGTTPVGDVIMGQYISNADWIAAGGALASGQFHGLRLTSGGVLMVDATFAGAVTVSAIVWGQRYYGKEEFAVGDGDQTIALGFDADQIIIANDDDTNSVWINYGGVAVADDSHDEILPGETFTDQFPSNNVHLITDKVTDITVRVWARAE